MDIGRLLARRSRLMSASGIRRIFELGARLDDPINLSIGQPDFAVPEPLKAAAIEAVRADRNGYTLTQGIPELRRAIEGSLSADLGWSFGGATGAMVTSGTSGGLLLACLALLEDGDEMIIPDPYFLVYPALATMCGARAVACDTYPDFRMTAERVEPLITERTKIVLLNSPSNPAGVVASAAECRGLLELCRARGLLLISDEIYDAFTYSEARTQRGGRQGGDAGGPPARSRDAGPGPVGTRCPSPGRFAGAEDCTLVVRGFGKTYGCTGWRLGYAAGPTALLDEMVKMQQYTFVCAPAPLQHAVLAAFDTDLTGLIEAYERRRDLVVERLAAVTEVTRPGGAFYAFFKVPERLGMSGTEFAEACIEKNLLVIPGGVFSGRDTHIRLSFAAPMERLEKGLAVLAGMMG
jgi:aspartate/methionine/tyrosine aminotransferase